MLIASSDAPEIDRYTGYHEEHDRESLEGLCEHGAGEEKDAHAAEDNGGGNPCLVRAGKFRFLDTQNNYAEHGEEVEGVTGNPVKRDEGAELANNDVTCGENRVENESIDWRIE